MDNGYWYTTIGCMKIWTFTNLDAKNSMKCFNPLDMAACLNLFFNARLNAKNLLWLLERLLLVIQQIIPLLRAWGLWSLKQLCNCVKASPSKDPSLSLKRLWWRHNDDKTIFFDIFANKVFDSKTWKQKCHDFIFFLWNFLLRSYNDFGEGTIYLRQIMTY
jgi:hypothetical protein